MDEGDFKIKAIFKGLLEEYTIDYQATPSYSDADPILIMRSNYIRVNLFSDFLRLMSLGYLLKPKLD